LSTDRWPHSRIILCLRKSLFIGWDLGPQKF
jgi:hypothetical protein